MANEHFGIYQELYYILSRSEVIIVQRGTKETKRGRPNL
jgi:hypothetical protein